MSDAPTPDVAALRAALLDIGIACRIEARARLAVLRCDHVAPDFADASLRAEVERRAQAHGFTHVALELA